MSYKPETQLLAELLLRDELTDCGGNELALYSSLEEFSSSTSDVAGAICSSSSAIKYNRCI